MSSLQAALSYIEEHPNELPGMSEMAELCHLSPSYFSRLFRREVGENFNSYVNRKKIEIAQQHLDEGSCSVGELAVLLGYTDSSYFIKVFKRYSGVTPLCYKRNKTKVLSEESL